MADRVDELIEEVLERALRREAFDVEALLGQHADLQPQERAQVRAIAASMELGPMDLPASATAPSEESTTSRTGESSPAGTFGAYHLLRVLGRGGQGVVYLAQDTRWDRRVALKILDRAERTFGGDGSPSSAAVRLRREAEIVSKLADAAIGVVYEMGACEGRPFIAMRYVEGETLASKIAAASAARRAVQIRAPVAEQGIGVGTSAVRRRDLMRCVECIERVARALHVAHAAHVIHRDIKPANIMVTPAGDPVVLDFGLARDDDEDAATLTLSGDVLGTPAYMAPEQVEARREHIGPCTDVYALGVVLYECLTLRRPFEAETREALYRAIVSSAVPDPRSLASSIPRDLAIVIATAMERDPRRRYQTAVHFAEDLRRVREHEPIRARPIGSALRLRRWAQRNPALAATSAATFVGLLAVIGVLERSRRQERVRALLATASSYAASDPIESMRYAVEATEIAQPLDAEAVQRLREAWSNLRESRRVRAHASRCTYLQPVGDGRWLVSAGEDLEVAVHDAGTLALVHRFPSFRAKPRVSASADGRWIAIASDADDLCIWSTASWEPRTILPAQADTGFQFSPDSQWLALALEGELSLVPVDGSRGRLSCFLDAQPSGELTWSADSRQVWVAQPWGFQRFDVAADHVRRASSWEPLGEPFSGAAAAGDSVVFVRAHGLTRVRCSDALAREEIGLTQNNSAVSWLRLDGCGERALVGYSTGGVDCVGLDAPHERTVLATSRTTFIDGALSSDGSQALLIRSDLSAFECEITSVPELIELSTSARVMTARWNDRDARDPIATSHVGGELRTWNVESNAQRACIDVAGKSPEIHGCDVTAGRLAVAGDRQVHVYGLATLARSVSLSGPTLEVRCIDLRSDGLQVAAGSQDGSVYVWDLPDGRLRTLRSPSDLSSEDAEVFALAYSPDGARLATSGCFGYVRLYDTRTFADPQILENERGLCWLAFDRTGERLVGVSSTSGVVHVWSIQQRVEIVQRPIGGNDAAGLRAPCAACFTRDGEHVAITSSDGALHLWDLRADRVQRVRLGDPRAHEGLRGLAYDARSGWLAVASEGGFIWIVDSGDGRVMTRVDTHESVRSLDVDGAGNVLVWQTFNPATNRVHVEPLDVLEAARSALGEIELADTARH